MTRKTSWSLRWLGELTVIVVGVLVALYADRWNEARSERELAGSFIGRLEIEIRSDSLLAEDYLDGLPEFMDARNSLLRYVEGGPLPERWGPGPGVILDAARYPDLSPPLAWTELLETTSLGVLPDAAIREALSRYYTVERRQVESRIEDAVGRAWDPYFEALYKIGWIVPSATGGQIPADSAAFRQAPGMRESLIGLGSAHGTYQVFAWRLRDASGAALAALESRSR